MSAQDNATGAVGRSRLGVAIGDEHWLIDLAEAGEILPIPDAVTMVPGTKPWFQGLANLRGSLFGVTDLNILQGLDRTECGKDARLLAFSDSLGLNAAVLVSKMMGLQHMDQMTVTQQCERPGQWAGDAWVDASGTQWRELHLSQLCRDEQFLSVNHE